MGCKRVGTGGLNCGIAGFKSLNLTPGLVLWPSESKFLHCSPHMQCIYCLLQPITMLFKSLKCHLWGQSADSKCTMCLKDRPGIGFVLSVK